MQGLQRESADRLDAKCCVEKELVAVQETNKGLQALAAKAEEVRQGLVPAGELTAARSALSTAEKRIADLERELKEAKAEASSADGRARAVVTAAAEERKVSNALVAGLQNDFSSLQSFITGLCRPLIGKFSASACSSCIMKSLLYSLPTSVHRSDYRQFGGGAVV